MSYTEEGLVYTGRLPVILKPLDRLPGEVQLNSVNDKNEAYLRASLLPSEAFDVDEHDDISLELRRQELKINLLLDLVGELLLLQTGVPPLMDFKLTPKGFECKLDTQVESAGQIFEISIYLIPSIPKAFKLYGNLLKEDDDNNIAIEFDGINRAVQDLLEKFIFGHHRRSIASGVTAQ